MRKYNEIFNKALRYFSLAAFITTAVISGNAKPAYPGLQTITTKDGETLKVRLTGDEFFHQYFTEDGYPLVEKDGNFYYCDYDAAGNILESNIKAVAPVKRTSAAKLYINNINKAALEERIRLRADKSPRRASMVDATAASPRKNAPAQAPSSNDGPPYERGYGLFPDLRFPAYGNQKAIVILVEYTDVKFNTSYDAKDYFTRMLNQDGFNDYGGTGSAAQYFRENSEGAFTPEFDVFGPIQLAHNQAYYGGNNWYGDDKDPGAMVKEACDALDSTVDFREYDRDGDGVVDNIFIFYAGQGEASGGGSNTVWPHSWNMSSAGYPNLYYDGVLVYTYGCSNEWETYYGAGRPDGVGTFVHEFSHVMGLPDLYATSYTSAFTPGSWSALDYGPYNNDGMTPPNYGAFERYALGWVKPREVDRAVSATLPAIDNNICGIIRSSKDTEFFLLENRQQTGWDTYIPHHGMLIWHIDYNSSVWSQNSVNNSSSHQYVDIEEADGTQNSYTISGDPFPGTSNKTSFTSSTNPAMKTWSGTGLNYPITDIKETGGVITFNVLGGSVTQLPVLETYEATDVTTDSFTLSWSEPDDDNDVFLSVYTLDDNDQPSYLDGYNNRNLGHVTSHTVTGAEPQNVYYYTVAQTSGWETSDYTEPKIAITGRLTIDYYGVVANEASEIDHASFVANWEPLEDATSYFLSVYTKELGEPHYEGTGFDNGINDIGDWILSSNITTYAMASYAGEAIPSLRMPTGSSVTSPTFDEPIIAVSFWHRGNSTSPNDRIDIYAYTPEGNQLVTSVPVETAAGGVTTVIREDMLPANTTRVQIQFVRLGDKGYLALDDVKVGCAYDFAPVYLPDYTEYEVGDVLSHTVTGLNPLTDYFYTVKASDGTLMSKASNEIGLTTLDGSSGKLNVITDGITLSVNGLTVSAAGEALEIRDMLGRVVARGMGSVSAPAPGVYIVSAPGKTTTLKVVLK